MLKNKGTKNMGAKKNQRATINKFPCRRHAEDRRINPTPPIFPIKDAMGARINNDRRWRPDRRYDVDIQWLRG